MTVWLLTEHHLEFLTLKGGYTGSSESTLVKYHMLESTCGYICLSIVVQEYCCYDLSFYSCSMTLLKYIEDIFFFELNTNYTSSSAVKKNQYFSRVRSTSENADIFTARDEIYLVFAEKKVNFLFILYSTEHRNHSLTFYLVVSRSI